MSYIVGVVVIVFLSAVVLDVLCTCFDGLKSLGNEVKKLLPKTHVCK